MDESSEESRGIVDVSESQQGMDTEDGNKRNSSPTEAKVQQK